MKSHFICVDFDATIVKHEYPKIGEEVPGAIDTLLRLQKAGHRLILLTMRGGKELEEAVIYLEERGIKLFGINENETQKFWTSSPKVYGHIYIDDAGLGCPLSWDGHSRPFVDWDKVSKRLLYLIVDLPNELENGGFHSCTLDEDGYCEECGKGADHPLWRGGRYLDKDGYVIINIEGKQVKAHRYIMEQVLGRKLRRDEVVHHINGNRQDNRVENLQVMTIGEHNKLHFTKDKKC